jgi:hypothetical protein
MDSGGVAAAEMADLLDETRQLIAIFTTIDKRSKGELKPRTKSNWWNPPSSRLRRDKGTPGNENFTEANEGNKDVTRAHCLSSFPSVKICRFRLHCVTPRQVGATSRG